MKFSKNPHFGLATFCVLLALGILLIDSKTPLGVAGGMPYVVVVLLALGLPKIRPAVYFACLSSLFILLGLWLSPTGGEWWQVIYNRALAFFIVWMTIGLGIRGKLLQERHEEILKEREEVLDHIRVLKGMIPICANCKRIRNEAGLWDQLEQYITEHSEADFTHGICPDCAKTYYGQETG